MFPFPAFRLIWRASDRAELLCFATTWHLHVYCYLLCTFASSMRTSDSIEESFILNIVIWIRDLATMRKSRNTQMRPASTDRIGCPISASQCSTYHPLQGLQSLAKTLQTDKFSSFALEIVRIRDENGRRRCHSRLSSRTGKTENRSENIRLASSFIVVISMLTFDRSIRW